MTQNENVETLDFDIDRESAIRHLIFRQDQKNVKAVMEAVQNAVDSDASNVSVNVDNASFCVVDNGAGMSYTTIKNYLMTLAASNKSSPDKIGQFGVGFAQTACAGRVTIRTREFRLVIDITEHPDLKGFPLERGLPEVEGTELSCEFFDPRVMDDKELSEVLDELRTRFIFPKTELVVNNELVEIPDMADAVEFPFTIMYEGKEMTATTYFIPSDRGCSTIHVKGMYIMPLHRSEIVGDFIVLANFLNVPISRNDILRDHVWKAFKRQVLEPFNIMQLRNFDKRKTMYEYTSQIINFYNNNMLSDDDVINMKFVKSIDDTYYSVRHLKAQGSVVNAYYINDNKIAVANIYRDKHQHACVIDACGAEKRFLQKIGVIVTDLDDLEEFTEFQRLAAGGVEALDLDEMMQVAAFARMHDYIDYANELIASALGVNKRKIEFVNTNKFAACTDGKTFIQIAYNQIPKRHNTRKPARMWWIFRVLVHEYAHVGNSYEAGHGSDFDARFRKYMENMFMADVIDHLSQTAIGGKHK